MSFRPLLHCAHGALLEIVGCGIGSQPTLAQPSDAPHVAMQAAGGELSYLDLGAGAFDIQGHRRTPAAAEGRVEFRYGRKLFFIGPAIGVLANTQGGIFGYGGFYADLRFDQLVVTPLIGIGGYHRGGSEDLGGTLEGRFSIALSYELRDRSRISVQFAHVSNAGVHTANPGNNELLLTYAIPLRLP